MAAFGESVCELLLDHGFGAAGVAISPAPVTGVLGLPPAQVARHLPGAPQPGQPERYGPLTPKLFRYNSMKTMALDEAKVAYGRYQVPGPGRMISRRRSPA